MGDEGSFLVIFFGSVIQYSGSFVHNEILQYYAFLKQRMAETLNAWARYMKNAHSSFDNLRSHFITLSKSMSVE